MNFVKRALSYLHNEVGGGFLGIGESEGQRQARKAGEKSWKTQLASTAQMRGIPVEQYEWYKEFARPHIETGLGAIGRRLRYEQTPAEKLQEEMMYGKAKKGVTRAGGMARKALQRRAGQTELTSPALMAEYGEIGEAEMEQMANLALQKAMMNQAKYEQALGTSLGLGGMAPGMGSVNMPAAPAFGGGAGGGGGGGEIGQLLYNLLRFGLGGGKGKRWQ